MRKLFAIFLIASTCYGAGTKSVSYDPDTGIVSLPPHGMLDFSQVLLEGIPGLSGGSGTTLPTFQQAGFAKQIWVTSRTDGLDGTGGEFDPLNGSTRARFDAVMTSITSNSIINLGVGTFETHGVGAKDGWQIIGQGQNKTTVKLSDHLAEAIGGDFSAFLSGSSLNYFGLESLTVDLNAANQGIVTGHQNGYLNAVNVISKSAAIRNVRILTAYAKPGEGFPCHIEHDGTTNDIDYVYFDRIEHVNPVGSMTAISFFDQLGGYISGQISNCSVVSTASGSDVVGYGGSNWKHVRVLNNKCVGVNTAMVIDTLSFYDTEIAGNSFSVIPDDSLVGGSGLVFNGAGVYELDIHDNTIVVGASGGNGLTGGSATTTLKIANNTITNNGGNQSVKLLSGAKGFFCNNILNEVSPSEFPSTTTFKVFKNFSPAGAALFASYDAVALKDSSNVFQTGTNQFLNGVDVIFGPTLDFTVDPNLRIYTHDDNYVELQWRERTSVKAVMNYDAGSSHLLNLYVPYGFRATNTIGGGTEILHLYPSTGVAIGADIDPGAGKLSVVSPDFGSIELMALGASADSQRLKFIWNVGSYEVRFLNDDGTVRKTPIRVTTEGSDTRTDLETLLLKPTAEPTPATEGTVYANASDHHLYFYNGSAWKQLDN